jgi:hypothetical protein
VRLLLRREKPQPSPDCTLGFLFGPGDLSVVSIERPWVPWDKGRGGTKGISCIPLGTYRLVRHNTEAHPMTWALVNEDLDVIHQPRADRPHARTAVLIHSANWAHELRGCIAPGTRAACDDEGRYMVQESRRAMALLKQRLPWTDEHTIEITEA